MWLKPPRKVGHWGGGYHIYVFFTGMAKRVMDCQGSFLGLAGARGCPVKPCGRAAVLTGPDYCRDLKSSKIPSIAVVIDTSNRLQLYWQLVRPACQGYPHGELSES